MIRMTALALLLVSATACTTTDTNETNQNSGWEDVKDGTKTAASGVGEMAEDAGEAVAEESKEIGNDIKSSACPVVADKDSHLYYTKTHKQYAVQLKGAKVLEKDRKKCFLSEANAVDDGYKAAR